MLLASVYTQVWADTEPNNDLSTANALALNANHSGTLGTPASDSDDWYVITLPNKGSVTATAVYDASLSGFVYFYRSNGSNINFSAGGTGSKVLTADCIGSQTIYVRVNRTSGQGAYSLVVTLASPSVSQDAEPNNIQAEIQQNYTAGQNFTGFLGHTNSVGAPDGDDWFSYTSPHDGNVTFSVTADAGLNIWVYLYRANGSLIGFSSNGSGLREITASCQQQGLIIGRINASSGCGSYSAQFNTSTLPNAIDAEPNNSQAAIINTYNKNQNFTGHIGYATPGNGTVDGDDWFYYNNPHDGNVTFSVTADPGLNIWVYLYRENGSQIGFSTNGSGLREYTAQCQQAGLIVGRINSSGGCGSYTAQFTTSNLPNAIDTEPNNALANIVSTYNKDQNFTGHLGYSNGIGTVDNDDWFYYDNPNNGDVTFSVTADAGLNIWVYLYRVNGSQLGFSTNGSGLRQYTAACQQEGLIVGRIFSSSGCGSYTANFTTTTPQYANDSGPNDDLASAAFTRFTKYTEGQIGYANTTNGTVDSDDYYSIKITQAPFTLSLPVTTTGTLTGWIYLYNGAGSNLIFFAHAPGVTQVNYTFNNPGVYYLRMYRSGGCGSYRFGEPCASGGDVDQDNICDSGDACLTNAGIISSASQLTGLCIGDGFSDVVSAQVANKYGPGTFGLVTFPALDVVATNATGTFNMEQYPAGNYRIGYVSVPALSALQGITNPSQLTGCYDLSNALAVSTLALVPGTITAAAGTTACGDDGNPSNLSFTSTGAQGPTFRWAVLTSDFSTVLANNTTGIFDFDQFGPGSYRVVRAVYSGLNPATIDPLNLPPCVRVSNIIVINITSCAAALQVQPNPTAGESNVSFTAQSDTWHTLEVYDMQGKLVQTLMSQMAQTDEIYRYSFDGSYLPNGVYLYRLTSGSDVMVQKFMIAR